MTSDPDIWNIAVSHRICDCFLNQTLLFFRLISYLTVTDTLWTAHMYILMVPTTSTPRRVVRRLTLQSLFIIDLLFVLTGDLSDICLLLTEHFTLSQGFRHGDGHMTFLWAVLGPRPGAELWNKTASILPLWGLFRSMSKFTVRDNNLCLNVRSTWDGIYKHW